MSYLTLLTYADMRGLTLDASSFTNTEHALGGTRNDHAETSSALTVSQIDFDAETNIQPDYLVIARADINRERDTADVQVKFIASASASFTSPETQTWTYGTSDLTGIMSQDLVKEFTLTTSYRYYRIEITSTASFKHRISKVLFGNKLDLEVDPHRPRRIPRTATYNRMKRSPYKFELSWYGVTNSKRNTVVRDIGRYMNVPLFLYAPTTGYGGALLDYELVHCKILGFRVEHTAYNTSGVDIRFEELI